MQNPHAPQAVAVPVEALGVQSRATFIGRTYIHLYGAISLFVIFEILMFKTTLGQNILGAMLGLPWLVILGGFIVVGWIATHVAHTARSKPVQYAALIGFVAAESIIFCPLLAYAEAFAPGVIQSAALVTLASFLGLTMIAFATRKDFSFLRGILWFGMICALGLIVASAIFGFSLGILFSVAMVALAGGSILYDTSNIIHHYPEDRYVGAALELFASVAMMFWYVIQLFLLSRD